MTDHPDTDTTPITDLATFIANLKFGDIPTDAVRLAERCVLDTVGVTVAGMTEGAGKAAAETFERWGDGNAKLLGRNQTLPLPTAVFINATAGHGLDFDDVSWGMGGHPSVPMVAPILALADDEDASGRAVITAYVAGFETQCYLNAPISPHHYERGWHATATLGTFGATAAAASILDLDQSQTRQALNIAASMPAGLKRNFGSMTKPMHVGQAARSGLTAALLATEGWTAAPNAIVGDRGFLDLYSGGVAPSYDAFYELGSRWALLGDGVHVKKYPCCYFTHSTIAGVVDLVETHDIPPRNIAEIDVVASKGTADALHHDDPENGLEAKFSMPYVVGYAVTNRMVDLAAFDDENVDDPTVQRVRETVSLSVNPELDYDSNATTIRLHTTDGSYYEHSLDHPPGTYSDPLSRETLHEKFRMCVDRATTTDSEEALTALDSLRDQHTITPILTYLQ
ncbi:MmgE/PrpD family protein [Haladaptatus sp. NG-WS-4]